MILLIKWLIGVLSILLSAYFLPGIEVAGLYIALIVAILLGVLNFTIKPILILLTLPINILTFGLFTFVINGFLLWFLSTFIAGFDIDGFGYAVLAGILVSIVNWLGNRFVLQEY